MANKKSVFSINLRRAREAKGWSQREAAEKIGIKRARLGAYEEGRAEPKHQLLIKICEIFDVEDLRLFIGKN